MRPRSTSPRLLAALALAGAWSCAMPVCAQLIVPSTRGAAWELLDEAFTGLSQAYLQQLEPTLWTEVRHGAERALDAARRARDAGAPDDLCLAAQRTLAALLERQELLDRQSSGDDAGPRGGLPRVADDLLFAEGRLPETSLLLAEVLFALERDQEGSDVLGRALVLWPGDVRLHESVRAWRFVVPQPEQLAGPLQARATTVGNGQPIASGMAFETAAMLHAVMGTRAYEQQDYALAGLHFDVAAKDLLRSQSMPRSLPESDVIDMRADAAVNAAMSFLGLAQQLWFAERGDTEGAPAAMAAAEESISVALRLRPTHEPTLNAVLFLGEAWKDKADVDQVTTHDLADARQFFGRMAERFDVADWWNNYAFWCRETATAAEADGDPAAARALYEESYAAYSRAIELAPDNARYVNDTGLILLYHLGRDLDRAEGLFKRAWELGREVYDNPFVDPGAAEENKSAFGDAMLNLARLYLQRGDTAMAKQVNDQLLELAPERPDAQLLDRQIDAAM